MPWVWNKNEFRKNRTFLPDAVSSSPSSAVFRSSSARASCSFADSLSSCFTLDFFFFLDLLTPDGLEPFSLSPPPIAVLYSSDGMFVVVEDEKQEKGGWKISMRKSREMSYDPNRLRDTVITELPRAFGTDGGRSMHNSPRTCHDRGLPRQI